MCIRVKDAIFVGVLVCRYYRYVQLLWLRETTYLLSEEIFHHLYNLKVKQTTPLVFYEKVFCIYGQKKAING